MIHVPGLPDAETQVYNTLVGQLKSKQPRNELRDRYMDAKKDVDLARWAANVPTLGAVLGWPAKAVETLARRCRLVGFTMDDAELSTFGIDELLDDNEYVRESRQGNVSSLVHAVSFEVVTKGAEGEPEVLITRVDGRNGTGLWSTRMRRLTSFLSVSEWDKHGIPSSWAMYLPGVTWVMQGGTLDRQSTVLDRVPVEPIVYKPRLGRPFGSSRITRPVMFLTQSAARVVIRSEATAQLYSAPGLIMLGLDAAQIESGSWLSGIGNVVGIPDSDEVASDSPTLARAQVVAVQQASQQPHVDQLRAWAQLFSGETSIPTSSLGISVDQANPASAEAYAASREDLIAEAEDASDEWGAARRRVIQMAWALREGVDLADIPVEVRSLRPQWRDPRYVSTAAAADAFTKLAGVIPGLAEADAALDMLGLDEALVARLRADLRRARGRATLASLVGSDAVSG